VVVLDLGMVLLLLEHLGKIVEMEVLEQVQEDI
jgi:hypothetical protein